MLRSFQYAAATAMTLRSDAIGAVSEGTRQRAALWRETFSKQFLEAYEAHSAENPTYPHDTAFARALTELFLLQKAFYEVGYELANRPNWLGVPLEGIVNLLQLEGDE